jgi:hypothetical protein
MKYKINIIVVILGLFFFNSCNDDQIISVPEKMEVDNGLKSFDSYDELFEELETVNNMTIEELIDYEDAQDFNSFGKISDQLYFNFLEDSTATFNEVLDFIKLHPKYVELVIESDTSFVPTYETNLRYIMNDDRMFKVQDTLFKVFKTGIVSTLYTNYDDLFHLEDKDLDDLDTSIFSYAPNYTAKLSNPEIRAAIVNNERIDFNLSYIVFSRLINSNNQKVEFFEVVTEVRPKHKFACYWHWAKRTISTNYSFTIAYNGNNSVTYSDNYTGTSPQFNRRYHFEFGSQIVSQYNNTIFTSLTGHVSQPNVTLYF